MGKAEIDLRIKFAEALLKTYTKLLEYRKGDSKELQEKVMELTKQLSNLYQQRESLE